jgi:hypothetical protein
MNKALNSSNYIFILLHGTFGSYASNHLARVNAGIHNLDCSPMIASKGNHLSNPQTFCMKSSVQPSVGGQNRRRSVRRRWRRYCEFLATLTRTCPQTAINEQMKYATGVLVNSNPQTVGWAAPSWFLCSKVTISSLPLYRSLSTSSNHTITEALVHFILSGI